jgi:nitrate reductase alpha subunit
MADWVQEKVAPEERKWEEFYRNRFAHDKRVRTTHGVNCTGSCSWEVFVKDGIVTWEMQATDYPLLEEGLPPYEPRGCQRGISFSWYLYSPLRVKYPYARGALLDLWRAARREHADPVEAWAAIVGDPEKRRRYQQARGKGGFRRIRWDEALEMIAASVIHTVKAHGPDRVIGFSPIPAMSQISYAAGSRFLTLLGGVAMSFYDWYCDLPPASPEIWGEQTDVHESADWYNSRFIRRPGGPAAPGAHQPHLVGQHQQRPRVRALHVERGRADPLAHVDRPPALLPGPPQLPAMGRASAHLQAAARSHHAGRAPA